MDVDLGQLKPPPVIPKVETVQEELVRVYRQIRTEILDHVVKARNEGKKPFVLVGDEHQPVDNNREGGSAFASEIMAAEVFGRINQVSNDVGNLAIEMSPSEAARSSKTFSQFPGHEENMVRIGEFMHLKVTGMDIEVPKEIAQAYVAATKGDKAAYKKFETWRDSTMDSREANMCEALKKLSGGMIMNGLLHTKGIVEGMAKDNASVLCIYSGQRLPSITEGTAIDVERAKFVHDDNKVKKIKFSPQIENIPPEKLVEEVVKAIEAANQPIPPSRVQGQAK